MPTLNIKDYLIAGLIVLLLGSISYSVYVDKQLGSKEDTIEEYKVLAKSQEAKMAVLKTQSIRTEEYLNEKYNVKLSMLNTTIDGLLNDSETSLLPPIPESTPDITRACFDREALDEAISGYRKGVQRLLAEGSKAVIGLDIAKEWIKTEEEIYRELDGKR